MNFIKMVVALFLIYPAINYADDCNLIIAASDYAPLTYNDNGNNVIGLDVELMNIIAKQAGCQVTWKPIMPWEQVIMGIKLGDLMFTTSASITPERSEFSKFIAYRPDSTKIFVRLEDLTKLKNINSLEDLIKNTDLKIGTYTGYHYGSSFERFYSDPKYKDRFIDMPDSAMIANFIKLQAYQIDAVILETVVGMNLIKKAGLGGQIVALEFELDNKGPSSFANIMISKVADPSDKYFNLLQNAVSIVKNTDEYKQIISNYMSDN